MIVNEPKSTQVQIEQILANIGNLTALTDKKPHTNWSAVKGPDITT